MNGSEILILGRNIAVLLIAFIAFMFDQMCKLFVVEISKIYDLEKGVDFVKNLLSIRWKNTGIAFGINASHGDNCAGYSADPGGNLHGSRTLI